MSPCAVSSAVEHYNDTVGVTGSNPVPRTIFLFAELICEVVVNTSMLTTIIATTILLGQRRPIVNLVVGQNAPDFELKYLGKNEKFKLSSNFGKRPTVLIFGSYT